MLKVIDTWKQFDHKSLRRASVFGTPGRERFETGNVAPCNISGTSMVDRRSWYKQSVSVVYPETRTEKNSRLRTAHAHRQQE